MPTGAIGLRVRTGRAVAILLEDTAEAPQAVARRKIDMWDDALPRTNGPYHLAMEAAGGAGEEIIRRATDAAVAAARRGIDSFASTHQLRGVGLVVGSLIDPDTLGQAHIRIHALEGRLYRQALEQAAAARGLPTLILLEKSALAEAARRSGQPIAAIEQMLAGFGRSLGRPWTAHERLAAVAAWIALTG